MPSVFLVSDTHFGHSNICKFTRDDGSKLRPWETSEEMNEAMIKLWNDTVRPNDKVYHVGDVVIKRKDLEILDRLNGDKVLIRGNHDIFKLSDYAKYFRDIRGTHKMDKFIISHYPIHPESISHWCSCNIHGHTHYRNVLNSDGSEDIRYFNVSVENTEFKPILFEKVKKIIEERINNSIIV